MCNNGKNEIRSSYLSLWELNDLLNAIVAIDSDGRSIIDLKLLPDERRESILRRWSRAFDVVNRESQTATLTGTNETSQANALLQYAPDFVVPHVHSVSAKMRQLIDLIVNAAGGDDDDENDATGGIGWEIGQLLLNYPEWRAEAEEALRVIADAANNSDVVAVARSCATLIEILEVIGDMMSPPGYVFFSDDCCRPTGWIANGAIILRELTLSRNCAVQAPDGGSQDELSFSS